MTNLAFYGTIYFETELQLFIFKVIEAEIMGDSMRLGYEQPLNVSLSRSRSWNAALNGPPSSSSFDSARVILN